MDVIRFTNPTSETKMEQGVVVSGLKSKLWIERYDTSGEFKFTAPATADIRNKLPIGSFVTHVDTSEVMIVENHEITDEEDQDSDIIISGRGYETFFEQRVIGGSAVSHKHNALIFAPLTIGDFLAEFIDMHVGGGSEDDALPYSEILNEVVGGPTGFYDFDYKKNLYENVLALLSSSSLGIKVVRPGIWSPLGPSSPNTAFVIHQGTDRRSEIMFSEDTGEVRHAEYLWSNKADKNTALVYGKWLQTLVTTAEVGYRRRMMFVEASDLDDQINELPPDPIETDPTISSILAAMQQRGIQALASQKLLALTKADISDNVSNATYRRDFNVGDIITVNGNYNETSVMRVVEYAEVEDETGFKGTPTVSVV